MSYADGAAADIDVAFRRFPARSTESVNVAIASAFPSVGQVSEMAMFPPFSVSAGSAEIASKITASRSAPSARWRAI